MTIPAQASPNRVNVIWNITGSKRPIIDTLKDILHIMVTEHPAKIVKVSQIFTNYGPIVGLNLELVTGKYYEVEHFKLDDSGVLALGLGIEFVVVFFTLTDKPAT